MLRGITVSQFEEWRHYSDLEPFDEERADARSAQVVQALHNVNRGRRAPVKLEDCLLRFGAPASAQPTTAAEAKVQADQVRRVMDAMIDSQWPKGKQRRRG